VKFELELWHLISLLITVVGAFWAMAKVLIAQNQSAIAEKFEAVTAHLVKQDDAAKQTEKAVNDLRLELARDYVRREDYTVAIATIMNKIDGLGLRMEHMFRDLMRGGAPRE